MMECAAALVNMGQFAPAMGPNEQVGCQEQKKSRGIAAARVSNREASNRVDRNHSRNPDDWITLTNLRKKHYPIVNQGGTLGPSVSMTCSQRFCQIKPASYVMHGGSSLENRLRRVAAGALFGKN